MLQRGHGPQSEVLSLLLHLRVGAGGGSRSAGHRKKDAPSPPASHSGLRQVRSAGYLFFYLSYFLDAEF